MDPALAVPSLLRIRLCTHRLGHYQGAPANPANSSEQSASIRPQQEDYELTGGNRFVCWIPKDTPISGLEFACGREPLF